LSKHVGERVTVSGTLIERQMQVRTLRRVASSCDGDDPGPRITAYRENRGARRSAGLFVPVSDTLSRLLD